MVFRFYTWTGVQRVALWLLSLFESALSLFEADAADISVLFFQLVLIFKKAILGHIWVIWMEKVSQRRKARCETLTTPRLVIAGRSLKGLDLAT